MLYGEGRIFKHSLFGGGRDHDDQAGHLVRIYIYDKSCGHFYSNSQLEPVPLISVGNYNIIPHFLSLRQRRGGNLYVWYICIFMFSRTTEENLWCVVGLMNVCSCRRLHHQHIQSLVHRDSHHIEIPIVWPRHILSAYILDSCVTSNRYSYVLLISPNYFFLLYVALGTNAFMHNVHQSLQQLVMSLYKKPPNLSNYSQITRIFLY